MSGRIRWFCPRHGEVIKPIGSTRCTQEGCQEKLWLDERGISHQDAYAAGLADGRAGQHRKSLNQAADDWEKMSMMKGTWPVEWLRKRAEEEPR